MTWPKRPVSYLHLGSIIPKMYANRTLTCTLETTQTQLLLRMFLVRNNGAICNTAAQHHHSKQKSWFTTYKQSSKSTLWAGDSPPCTALPMLNSHLRAINKNTEIAQKSKERQCRTTHIAHPGMDCRAEFLKNMS